MPTILITGSNRGIGFELAKHYAGEGWRVIATCRDPAGAQELSKLAEASDQVTVYPLDVTDQSSVDALSRSLTDTPIDLLFNNAGRLGDRAGQGFGAIDYDAWRWELEVNLLAPVRMVEAFVDNVAASDGKQIAVISSILGSLAEASGGLYAYRTSKAAVNMAVRAMASDLAARGISVMTFHPGWVRTDMGGPSAAVAPEDSAAGLAGVLAGLGPEDSSRFMRYDGVELDW
jgi:NAD(P)-dependent dehydrogenase (short-subunit alcohol dehydrogenase family)